MDSQDSLTPESVGNSPLSQKVLSSKIENRQFSNLFHSATLTDRARLLSISSPHTSAWLSVTPSPRLNLHLEPAELQVALKWWLDILLVGGQSCPHCPSFVLDDFGHHSLSCKHGGDVVSRHNKLCDIFSANVLAWVHVWRWAVGLGPFPNPALQMFLSLTGTLAYQLPLTCPSRPRYIQVFY